MTVEEQIRDLTSNIREFSGYMNSLPENLFLKKLDDWAPRDILAHLIGWNRSTIEGCQEIMASRVPLYFIDPGHDFSKFNAILVQEYNSKDRGRLIEELEVSTQELELFLLSIDPADWEADYGVTYKGGSVTVRNTVEALNIDYVKHRRQVQKWAESQHIDSSNV